MENNKKTKHRPRPTRYIPIPLNPVPFQFDDTFTPTEAVGKIFLKINEIIEHINEINYILNDLSDYLEPLVEKYIEEYVANLQTQIDTLNTTLQDAQQQIINNYNEYLASLDRIDLEILEALAAAKIYAEKYTNEHIQTSTDYTDYKITELDNKITQMIEDADVLPQFCPVDYQFKNLQHIIYHIYNDNRVNALTAEQYDNMELTALDFDNIGVICYNYDMNGKNMFNWEP